MNCQLSITGSPPSGDRLKHICSQCGRTVWLPAGCNLKHVRRNCTAGTPALSTPAAGVGTELKSLLSWFGYRPKLTPDGKTRRCKCDQHAAEMDRRGIDWCEANQREIVGWLRESAAELGMLFFEPAAWAAVKAAIALAKLKAESGGSN